MRSLIPAVIVAALTLTGCAGTSGAKTPPSATPAAVAPSPTYDGSTLDACREADAVSNSGTDFKASLQHAKFARSSAALSDVPALREVARKNSQEEAGTPIDDTYAMTAALTVETWCLQHHVKVPPAAGG